MTRGARNLAVLAGLVLAALSGRVLAGTQQYEPLAASVRAALQRSVSDLAAPLPSVDSNAQATVWLAAMAPRLSRRIPDERERLDLLRTVHYEATRAGLDPQLVLGLIEVESAFRKYAVSTAGARGFMQVMPFWVGVIGSPDNNLFHLRTNLRYGCTILRHYLDIENGNLFRALGRYNGSLGKAEYPNLVLRAWHANWSVAAVTGPQLAPTATAAQAPVPRRVSEIRITRN